MESVEEKAATLGDFSHYDPIDHIHGKHISKYRGQIDYYRDYLNKKSIERIHSHFEKIFSRFKYSADF